MRIDLMIAGQESVIWPQWLALAQAAERAGIEGLFRSDHYASMQDRPDRSSLDAWSTITALAAVTSRIRLGTLVSPTTFRHPSVLAKSAVTADHISGGRIELGIGAGWHAGEHHTYGLPFPDIRTRYDRFAEQLQIIARQLAGERFGFDGEHYQLADCQANPLPVQPRLPIIVGGRAGGRSAQLAARWADEYNTAFPTFAEARHRKDAVDRACEHLDREALPFSIMTGCILGRDEDEVRQRACRFMHQSGTAGDVAAWLDDLRATWIIGTPDQAAEQLRGYAAAGVTRAFLRHQLHDDLDMLDLVAELATQVAER